jgi:AcrR family transcriptional regulator
MRTRRAKGCRPQPHACYAEKGPVRTRMSEIARRAGVHRSTVYYYFSKKDTLLAASFVRPRRHGSR